MRMDRFALRGTAVRFSLPLAVAVLLAAAVSVQAVPIRVLSGTSASNAAPASVTADVASANGTSGAPVPSATAPSAATSPAPTAATTDATTLPVLKLPATTAGTSTSIECSELPLKNVGKLLLHTGSISFSSGAKVQVGAVPEWLFDKHIVLSGKLLQAKVNTQGTASTVDGLIYFNDGTWVSQLGPSSYNDSIVTTDGAALNGRVRSISDTGIDFQLSSGQTQRIALSSIQSVSSPRAFRFSVPATGLKLSGDGAIEGDAASIALTPSSTLRRALAAKPTTPRSTLRGTEGGVTKGQVASVLMIDAATTLIPFIAAPIVVGSGQSAAKRTLNNYNLGQQFQDLQQDSGN